MPYKESMETVKIEVKTIRYFKEIYSSSKVYWLSNDFLESSIDCKIGFQLKYGLMDWGSEDKEKKVPEVKNNILEIHDSRFLKNGITWQKNLKNNPAEKLNIPNRKKDINKTATFEIMISCLIKNIVTRVIK